MEKKSKKIKSLEEKNEIGSKLFPRWYAEKVPPAKQRKTRNPPPLPRGVGGFTANAREIPFLPTCWY
jgi:hypothetical protein